MRAWLLASLLSVAGCAADVTEIVLEVQSDLDLDTVEVDVSRPTGERWSATADLEALPLPRTLTLVHAGGALGPIVVEVRGMSSGARVVTRQLSLSFEEGASLRFIVMLAGSCSGVTCPADQTCDAGVCRPALVMPCEAVGRSCVDAGVADAAAVDAAPADACAPMESCNGIDDDCDDLVDEGIDTTSDATHCGVCGRVCPMSGPHALGGSCIASTCVLECERGWGDCNRDPADGCEVDVNTAMMHCGACDAFCPAAGTFHARDSVCTGGRCILSCDPDWGDCDGDRATGCETHVSIDRNHCGTCGNVCPDGQSCRSSTCT